MGSAFFKYDKWIAMAAGIGFALSVWFIFFGSFTKNELHLRGPSIGFIHSKQGDVRLKEKDTLDWKGAITRQGVIYDDSIFVGASSTAHLKVGESDLHLNANTLIVLRKSFDSNILNLSFGSLIGDLKPQEKLLIESKDGKRIYIEALEKTKIIIQSSENGDAEVEVISGVAHVQSGKRIQTLTANTSFSNTSEIQTSPETPTLVPEPLAEADGPPEVTYPVSNSIVVRNSPLDLVQINYDLKTEYPYIWYEVYDSLSEKPLYSEIVPVKELSLRMPDGDHRVRVRGYEAADVMSDWSPLVDFKVESTVPIDPEAIPPRPKEERKMQKLAIQAPKDHFDRLVASQNKRAPKPPVSEPLTEDPPTASALVADVNDTNQTQILKTTAPTVSRPSLKNRIWKFFVGAGQSLINSSQNGNVVSELSYSSTQNQSFSAAAEVVVNDRYGLELSYFHSAGQVRSEFAQLLRNHFSWKMMGAEGKYHFGDFHQYALLFGLFQQEYPYLQITDFDIADVRGMAMTQATLGAMWKTHWSKNLKSELLFRYAHLLSQKESNGDMLMISPDLTLNGSMGLSYIFDNNVSLGLILFGQHHSYRYRMQNAFTGNMDSGQKSVLFSNFEMKMGYSF